MIALPIISVVAFMAFLVLILFKIGVPVSFSETFYLLPGKWRWLFSAWVVLTATPLGIYWFTISPYNLKWMSVVCTIGLLFVSVSCDYKSPASQDWYAVKATPNKSKLSLKDKLIDIIKSLSPKNLFKYGWTKPIHYFNSLLAMVLSTIYLCMVTPYAITSTVLLYPTFILIGMKVDGVYNALYTLDVNQKAWIFLMEVICFMNLYIFIFLL